MHQIKLKCNIQKLLTYLFFRFHECTINIIFRLPHPWDTLLVISEPLLEVISEFAKEHLVGSLFADLCSQNLPGSFPQVSQRSRILFLRTVITYSYVVNELRQGMGILTLGLC